MYPLSVAAKTVIPLSCRQKDEAGERPLLLLGEGLVRTAWGRLGSVAGDPEGDLGLAGSNSPPAEFPGNGERAD